MFYKITKCIIIIYIIKNKNISYLAIYEMFGAYIQFSCSLSFFSFFYFFCVMGDRWHILS